MKKVLLAVAIFAFAGVGIANTYAINNEGVQVVKNDDDKKKKKKKKKDDCCAPKTEANAANGEANAADGVKAETEKKSCSSTAGTEKKSCCSSKKTEEKPVN
jgi:hypothetical protein